MPLFLKLAWCWLMMAVIFCCRVPLMVLVSLVERASCLFSFLNNCKRCGASCGRGKGLSGRSSSFANAASAMLSFPAATSLSNKRFLLSTSNCLFLPGCTSEGALGNTANVAISAQLSCCGLRPKYRQAAASSPTTLLPKGALLAYKANISFLE